LDERSRIAPSLDLATRSPDIEVLSEAFVKQAAVADGRAVIGL
jgi:hypothetical protein